MSAPSPRIGLSTDDSVSPPLPERFRAGAPNVLVVVLDDVGFSQLGCFGGPVDTPAFDRLAARGLRFTGFHTTALCAPTRACLLTGRNHHRVGMGFLPDLPMRFPGYDGHIPDEAATLAQILGDAGWSTTCIGKWHLTPRSERTPAGPYDQWPLGKGFERYYGFLGGDTNQWTPDLVRDNTYVDPPRAPEHGYHLTEDLADEAIARLDEVHHTQPGRPFCLWFATGAGHAPHHAPREWIEHHAGRFDHGWDAERDATLVRQKEMGIVPEHTELSPRPPWVAAWDSLSDGEKHLYARMMEVYAGFLSHTDHQVGRVLDHLEHTGRLDDTIVVVVSDNGASAEGGPHGSVNELRFIAGLHEDLEANLAKIDDLGGWRSYGHYPWGWALAGNTPLRRWKRYTWEGGVRDPLIVSWPAGIGDHGGVRSQYCHAIDVMPTLLDCCDVEPPTERRGVAQMSLDGVSLRSTFDAADTPEVRTTQYYEMWGSRAIYHDGWKAVTDHVNQQHPAERDLTEGSTDFGADRWLLFDTRSDPAEVHDVAGEHPEVLADLQDRWWAEAERNQVLPLDDGFASRLAHIDVSWAAPRAHYALPTGARVHEEAGPMFAGTDFTMTADLGDGYRPGHEGVLCEQGDWNNGWAWFVAAGRVTWVLCYVAESEHRVVAEIPPGTRRLAFTYEQTPDGPGAGRGRLLADGVEIGAADVAAPFPFRWSPDGKFLTVGFGRGFPVCDDYETPFAYTGDLRGVAIDLESPLPSAGTPEDFEAVLRHQ